MSAETINGARIVLETLHRLGVTDMFGYPGGAVIPIYDEIYSFPEIKHYFVRHEQGAAHAADGYARVSGRVGVCLATSGPGATNLVTGIMTAYMDSVPMVAITGQVGRPFIGKDSFQEADIQGITMPITKHNCLVQDIHDLPRIIKEAYFIAGTGRPGPVLIDIPRIFKQKKYPWRNTSNCTKYLFILKAMIQPIKVIKVKSKKQLLSSKTQSAHLSLLGQVY